MVLALPGSGKKLKIGKEHEARTDRSDAQRGAFHALFPVVTYSRPEVRKRAIGSVTRIG